MKVISHRRKFIKQFTASTLSVIAGSSFITRGSEAPASNANVKPLSSLAKSEELSWDTYRGHFRMSFTLDPPVKNWNVKQRIHPDKIEGEYEGEGYSLKIRETKLETETSLINYELSRSDGLKFMVLENHVICRTSYAEVYKMFTPSSMRQQFYMVDLPFALGGHTRAELDQPVLWMQDTTGRNTLTFGLIDQIQATNIEGLTYHPPYDGGEGPGIANIYIRAIINRVGATSEPVSTYKDALYVNANSKITWFDALRKYSEVVDKERGFIEKQKSSWALNPMWHSYYAYVDHINQEKIEKDAKVAADLGISTIQIDAGWNIPPELEYSFDTDGDYKFDESRFPDAKRMINKMHNSGQRVILHVSPLLMGKYSKSWEMMNDCMIQVKGKSSSYLDPRIQKVHDYLLKSWKYLFEEYNIDGLWYDFLEIPFQADLPLGNHELVSINLHSAFTILMQSLYQKALSMKPDAIIVLRRPSANLNSKLYCTHVWPMDTPQDYNMNRRDVIYMKTFGKGVVTHACCTSWAISELDVNVARQMASIVLAGVPSFSVMLNTSPPSHNKIIKAWLAFYNKNKEDLVLSDMQPLLPTPPSAAIRIQGETKAFFGFFEAVIGLIQVSKPVKKVTIVNAFSERTSTRIEGIVGSWHIQVYDQVWKLVEENILKVDQQNGLNINILGPSACHITVLKRLNND